MSKPQLTQRDFYKRYKTKGTYLVWDKKNNDVLRWMGDNDIYFAGKEDADNTFKAFGGKKLSPELQVVSAEKLKEVSPKHYKEYLKAIDRCIKSGEITV